MKRILTAAVLAPLITWVVIWSHYYIFAAVLGTVAALCYWEFCGIAEGHGIRIPRAPGIACGLVVLFGPSDLTVAVLLAIVPLVIALGSADLREALPRSAAFTLGILYVFGCWHTGVALRAINPHWLMFALALNWLGDTAAMAAGRTFGRHKLAPRVSPGKSWEGSIASVLASVLFGILYAHWAMPDVAMPMAALVAAAGNAAGQVGDLCESALKRGAGMKDSGTLLPGHGGWLDRVDSSLFAVPVVYALLLAARTWR
jgi:phosphatidate cytidylyltransferase